MCKFFVVKKKLRYGKDCDLNIRYEKFLFFNFVVKLHVHVPPQNYFNCESFPIYSICLCFGYKPSGAYWRLVGQWLATGACCTIRSFTLHANELQIPLLTYEAVLIQTFFALEAYVGAFQECFINACCILIGYVYITRPQGLHSMFVTRDAAA